VLAVAPVNRLVDREDPQIVQAMAADTPMHDLVQGYAALAAPLADAVIGTLATALPATANAAGEMPAGSLVADAQLRATQASAAGGAQVALMNSGGVRSPGFVPPPGTAAPFGLSYGAAFTVQPFGNSLVTMTLTVAQLKTLLEQQFRGCGGQAENRVLQVSDGLQVSWRASAPPCARIVDVTFTPTDVSTVPPRAMGAPQRLVKDGIVQDPQRTLRVTVNNFMATGGDGLSTLTAGTDRIGGAQDIDALRSFLAGWQAAGRPYDLRDPSLGEPRLTRLP
jgi:5'-nucleotidase